MVIHVWAGDGRGGASEARCPAQSRAPLPVRVSVQDLMKAGERRLEERGWQVPQTFGPPPSQPVAQASGQLTDLLHSERQ